MPQTKSNVVVHKKSSAANPTNAEEHEITAQITVPTDGGWAWVVLAVSSLTTCVTDGIAFTFGSVMDVLVKDLGSTESSIALINSLLIASYYCFGPLVSASINRFGFRFACMFGSVISATCLFFTYVVGNYSTLIFLYGVGAGLGFAFINLSAVLIVGFYFHKYRTLAFTITVTGSSIGIALFYPINSWVCHLTGWRTLFLLHSSLMCLLYFTAMTFRPPLSMTVVQTTEANDPTKTVTFLPTMATVDPQSDAVRATATERFFSAVSTMNFPTAATVMEETPITQDAISDPGPSIGAVSRVKLVTNNPDQVTHQKEIEHLKSVIMKSQAHVHSAVNVGIVFTEPETRQTKKTGFFARIFHWEKHVDESRPLYRDDIFFETTPTAAKEDAIDYQFKVSRALTTKDLHERRGICTTAFRRILSTMLDLKLLKKKSFICLCLSTILLFSGYLIPFVYVASRGKSYGIKENYCSLLVSVISISSLIGRFFISALANKISPLKISVFLYLSTGTVTMLSGLGRTVTTQCIFCVIFGVGVSGVTTIRSLVFVDLYGLENLTNCTGMIVVFSGLGCLISSPVGGLLITNFGFDAAFLFSGGCIFLSAIFQLPVSRFVRMERSPAPPPLVVKSVPNFEPNHLVY